MIMPVIRGNASVYGLADGSGEMPEEPGAGREETVRELVGDRALDLLLARPEDEAGQLRLTGEGSMLGELVRAVLKRALEAEMAAHLGYEPHQRAGPSTSTQTSAGRLSSTRASKNRGAGVKVELDGYADLAEAQGVGKVFVAEHVELGDLDVGGRTPGRVGDAGQGGVGGVSGPPAAL